MSQKTGVTQVTQKQSGPKKFAVYIERYREIELYLTLLTKPLLPNLVPTTMVGTEPLYEKVEKEIKEFLEKKLQILTGMTQPSESLELSKDEVSALKLVASTILKKEVKPAPEPVVEKPDSTYVRSEGTVVKAEPVPTPFDKEPEVEEVEEPVVETEEVVVQQVEASPAKKAKKASKTQKAVLPTEVPFVEKGTDTSTMKKARPVGVKPMPPPPENQQASLAVAQAEALQQEILAAQMQQAAQILPDNLGMPNLTGPLFR